MVFEERLHQLSVGTEKENMYSQWKTIKNETESRLKTVSNYFPHFSKHDGSHSQAIATYIGNLLGEDRINKLSYSDILIMLLSFYKHDIGMALEYEEIHSYFQHSNFKDTLAKYANDQTSDLYEKAKRLQRFGGVIEAKDYETSIDVYNDVILVIEDLYRSEHAVRSANAIRDDSFLENTLHSRCQRILADICETHQKKISDIEKLQWKENGLFGDYFHPRFISAMLCLGDLLDLDTDRFDEIMMKASTPFPHLSKVHLEKHKSVRHFLVDRNIIEVSADTDDIEVYRVMRKWMDWMQEACDYIALHWSEIAPDDFGNAPRIAKCELLLHGNTKWLPFSNMKYEVSSKRMFELLQGSKIYDNKFVCIREIIQNSVDATLLRIFSEGILSGNDKSVLHQLETIKWDDYKITGDIAIIDSSHVSVRIRDRGIGVSTDDIKKIANVSNATGFKRKELISKMPMWLRPSGAFGIGMQSIFLLADQFEMITKTVDEPAKKIVFQSAEKSEGYITVEDFNEPFTQGTELRFIINGEKLSAAELDCSNYHYSRKELSYPVMSMIYDEYENQNRDIDILRMKHIKKADYIPIVIEYEQPVDRTRCILLEYEPLFSKKGMGNNVEIRSGFIEVKKFVPELKCYIISSMHLKERHPKDEAFHVYRDITNVAIHYSGAIFYRNTFVKEQTLPASFFVNDPIMKYMEWEINLLDANSDEVLKLSRNSINENYSKIFYRMLWKALELAAMDAINSLINKYDDRIGDTILILYQIAVLLNHRSEEIYNKYKNILGLIKIGNYYQWGKPDGEEYIINFDELRSKELYFIVNEVVCYDGIRATDLNDKKCIKYGRRGCQHILDHKINKLFLGQIDGQYVKVISAVPFKCNSLDSLYEIEDIFMLENVIRMIKLNLRIIPAVRGYEALVTPINFGSQLFYNVLTCEQYYIEMPFNDIMSEMAEILLDEGYIPNSVEKYYGQVLESTLFTANIDYIRDITNEKKSLIQDKYQQIVRKCLELLGDEKYKEFNKDILAKLDREISNLRNIDVIEQSPYCSFKNIMSDIH